MADVPFLTKDRNNIDVALPTAKLVAEAVETASDAAGTRHTALVGLVNDVETLLTALGINLASQTTLVDLLARFPTLGPKAGGGSVSTTPSTDQDPIFDHANGTKANVGTNSTLIVTPPAGCKYLRIVSDADVLIRADGAAAADTGGVTRLIANVPEVIPVTAAQAVNGIVATGTAVVRATPLKAR